MTPAQLKMAAEGYALKADREAWKIGLYVRAALMDVVASAVGKGGSSVRYPERPFGEQQEKAESVQDTEERDRIIAKLYMQNMVRAGRSWGKK
jgi:hypothetical protein